MPSKSRIGTYKKILETMPVLTKENTLESIGILYLDNDESGKNSSSFKEIIKPLHELMLREDIDTIQVLINCQGGAVEGFFPLYDMLNIAKKYHKKRIITIANGQALSGAAFVLQAGNVRLATQSSDIMIHGLQVDGFEGSLFEMEQCVKAAQKNNRRMLDVFAANMKVTVPKLLKMINSGGGELWFDAKEALEVNLIDEIIT